MGDLQPKWTYRDILIDNNHKQIDEKATELAQSGSGSPAYIACYTKAVKAIEESLDEDTRVKYRADAKKWSQQMPPPQKQMQYV
jgi:hypothetical protein